MPIRPEMKARYPKDWKLRSYFVRFVRAKGRCERCGVINYTVGQWIEGRFIPIGGNIYLDDKQYRSNYTEAQQVCNEANSWGWEEEPKFIVIVLTTAHIYDKRPEAASLLNLAALCQRCHLEHDKEDHIQTRKLSAERIGGQARLFA